LIGVFRAASLWVVIAMLVIGGLLLAPDWSSQIWTAGALAASVVVLAEIFLAIGASKKEGRSSFEQSLGSWSPPPDRPADLEKLERALGWRSYSGAEYDHRVRPVLRRVAAARSGRAEPTPSLAILMSDRATEGAVRTSDIELIVAEIEGQGR
jgi:hypothetical protein